MKWHDLWPFARTWWGWVVGIVSVLLAIFHGPNLVFKAWDDYCERFRDGEVLFIFHQRKIGGAVRSNFPQLNTPSAEMPYTIPELAAMLGRKEKSIVSSIRRLFRNGKIEPYQDGWRLKH